MTETTTQSNKRRFTLYSELPMIKNANTVQIPSLDLKKNTLSRLDIFSVISVPNTLYTWQGHSDLRSVFLTVSDPSLHCFSKQVASTVLSSQTSSTCWSVTVTQTGVKTTSSMISHLEDVMNTI